jgi:hypothetical protein
MINAKNKLLTTADILACCVSLSAQAQQALELGVLTCDTVTGTGLGLSGGVGYLYIEPASR